MKTVATVSAIICITAIACSLTSIPIPSGNTRRVINIVIGAFILCCMIIPVKNAVSDFSFNISIADSVDDLASGADKAYNDAVIVETSSLLKSRLKQELWQNDIKTQKIEINLLCDDSGGIYIKDISIYISKEYESKSPKIYDLTKERYEIAPVIVVR